MVIHCTYKDIIPVEDISFGMCKSLKIRSKKELYAEIRRLLEYGFLTPVFVWKNEYVNEVVDGVGRIMAVNEINTYNLGIDSDGEIKENIGNHIESVPVVYIEADSIDEARRKVILANSMFGKIDKDELATFSEISGEDVYYIDCHAGFFEREQIQEVNINIGEYIGVSGYIPNFSFEEVKQEQVEKAKKELAKKPLKKSIDTENLEEIVCRSCGNRFAIRRKWSKS